ncbi:MAG: UDP-N-acetylmuramoyl-L-alanine--D-glutamate ligase [Rickettsiales bacterium]|jgi:UDP-N-acetylmuramoylalanine--D-glutamate ligase|nr:UDP-N-acetylmuramoyl-L-alanine--D-glutamate ligase [Rickettsiales bacterium]
MKVADFLGKKTYIWGIPGVEGDAVAALFRAHGVPFGVIEKDVIPDDAEVVVKAPGISIYKPEYIAAAKRGVRFTQLMNIFLSEWAGRSPVIAITGTKGKTTTASMLAFMLGRLGKRVGLGGNIGTPPLDFLGQKLDYVVLELSNFQIASLDDIWPDIVQVVSISPAHLDWHQNYENYKRDKLRLLPHAKLALLCGHDEYLKSLALPNARFYYRTALPLPMLQVVGEHNIINLSGALEIVRELGFDPVAALATMPDFKPIEHRLEKVHEKGRWLFINDSIATVAESVIAGVKAFAGRPIAVIVGGYDNKSANYGELSKFLTVNKSVKIIVGLPDTGRLIESPKLKMVGASMQEAVDAAVAALPDGGVVLLSPAAQSFNMYKNYKERGHDFTACAKRAV